tara:strand:+ start:34 stop:645 length:612 start_codon:yes stop_codon:yes gene_type:complete
MPTFAFLSVCAVPFLWVFLRAICLLIFDKNYFGADPGMELVTFFGKVAIVFLFMTLSFSHLGRPSKTLGVPRMRRILGLSVFFYGTLHLVSYLIFLAGFEFEKYYYDLMTKKRIILGSLAYFFLFLLAATSIDSVARNLGRAWVYLHRSVYLIAGLVVFHVFLSAKENFSFSVLLFCAYLVLLGFGLSKSWRKSKSRTPIFKA